MNSFYIELQSNSKCFYDNTVANFKNKLSLHEPLQGYWEVALVEISYTYSWKNLLNNEYVSLENERFIENFDKNYIPKNKFTIKSGFYDSIQALCNEIEMQLAHAD